MKAMFLSVAVTAIAASANAGVTLAAWTFETSVPTTAGPHAAEGGIFGGDASAFHASTATVYSNPVGNGSFESYSSNNWSTGDYYQFTTSTLGYQDVEFGWSQTRSSTGPGAFKVQWSADGVNFADLLSYTIEAISWSSALGNPLSVFVPVVLPDAADNLATVYVRLTSEVTTAAGGTNRVDDIFFNGSEIPAPGALALIGLAGLVGSRRRRA